MLAEIRQEESVLQCYRMWLKMEVIPSQLFLRGKFLLLRIFTRKSLANTSHTKCKCWTVVDYAMFSTYKIHNSIQ